MKPCIALTLLIALTPAAHAQSWPTKPVRLVFSVPASGTPGEVIARLQAAVTKVVNTPGTRAQFEKLGYDAVANTPAKFAAHIRTDYDKNGKIIKLIGAKVD